MRTTIEMRAEHRAGPVVLAGARGERPRTLVPRVLDLDAADRAAAVGGDRFRGLPDRGVEVMAR